jgi:cytokinin riboside 5'-monophosphate phosphoribohydrolase
MKKKICVFCSSSDQIATIFHQAANDLAQHIADNQDELVYGGSDVGLMRRLATRLKSIGVKVTGIIPQKIFDKNLAYKELDKLIIAPDMQTRKMQLIKESDAFIVMPGGFGTIDELMDVMTEKQLQYHDKPLVLLNIEGFFDPLLVFFEKLYKLNFTKPEYKALYFVTDKVEEAYTYINRYKGAGLTQKWF